MIADYSAAAAAVTDLADLVQNLSVAAAADALAVVAVAVVAAAAAVAESRPSVQVLWAGE